MIRIVQAVAQFFRLFLPSSTRGAQGLAKPGFSRFQLRQFRGRVPPCGGPGVLGIAGQRMGGSARRRRRRRQSSSSIAIPVIAIPVVVLIFDPHRTAGIKADPFAGSTIIIMIIIPLLLSFSFRDAVVPIQLHVKDSVLLLLRGGTTAEGTAGGRRVIIVVVLFGGLTFIFLFGRVRGIVLFAIIMTMVRLAAAALVAAAAATATILMMMVLIMMMMVGGGGNSSRGPLAPSHQPGKPLAQGGAAPAGRCCCGGAVVVVARRRRLHPRGAAGFVLV
mmetsp:Transcript_6829/g.19084  ORF Transcript_6829/g.19084 Transcript_6829/m.19084 type:complete len:276 (-) Transcript_6829:127-954(-)